MDQVRSSERKEAHIRRLLEPGQVRAVFQPIVRLADLEPVGYEGLARFPYVNGLAHLPPDVTLAAAGEIGLRHELEAACWEAMTTAGAPPAGRLLFVNINPDSLGHPALLAMADRLPSRLVIEITEQRAVGDYGALRDRLAPWLSRGAAVAIDDTGAGYASLQHVVELRPDFLKLTRRLVADIDRDPNRQALLRALAAFAREVGAAIVAEGVERAEELEILREAEIDLAQGWLFGRPGPPWPHVRRVRPARRESRVTDSAIRRLGRVEGALAAAETVEAACTAAVDHLRGLGLLPAVYLAQGGRLRCQAAHGFWAIHDGLPAQAGVVGHAYRTGETTVVSDVRAVPEYLSPAPSIRSELAVPLKVGARVVGVVNAESTTPLTAEPAREVERVSRILSRRLGRLGALDEPTPGQRLARAAARTAAMQDPAAVIRETAAAASDVTGMDSVAVVLVDKVGEFRLEHATGVFAQTFADLGTADLLAIAGWVRQGTTARTMGDRSGKAPRCLDVLRRAGVGSLCVVPLAVSGERLGFAAVADRSPSVLAPEPTEMLELLGVQAAAQLRGLAAVADLRDRARRDPLTGLGHRAAFHAALGQGRAAAARTGRRLAVLLADVDEFKDVNDRGGHAAGDELLRAAAAMLREVAPSAGSAFRVGGDEFAILVEVERGGGAQEVAWRLQAEARERLGTTLSIGVALASDAETDAEVLERAHRALAEVKRRGRDGVAVATPSLRSA